MLVVRVDNRLVHGQIIEGWLPFTGAKHLLVANDVMALDALYTHILSLAVPARVQLHVLRLADVAQCVQRYKQHKLLVLFENLQDLQQVVHSALVHPLLDDFLHEIEYINIGNLHHGEHKRNLLPHVSVTQEECQILKELAERFTLDFRCIPSEKRRSVHEFSL